MAYLISETGRELLEDVRRFCRKEGSDACRMVDRTGLGGEKLLQKVRELGYQCLTVPEEYGGLGIGRMDTAAILEEIARTDAGLATSISTGNLALRTVMLAGSEEQKEQAAKLVLEGGLGAFCLTEEQAGSDVRAVETVARRQPDGSYVLSGSKRFVTNGGNAAFYCILARVIDEDGAGEVKRAEGRPGEPGNPEVPGEPGGPGGRPEGSGGLTMFLIPAGTPGLISGPPEEKLGLKTCDTCEVILDGCRVADDLCAGVLGCVGEGQKLALRALSEGRIWMGCLAVGTAQRALDEAVAYSKKRIQFGRALIENQALAFRLADMDMLIESARQMVAYGLTRMEEEDFSREAAMAKCLGAEAAVAATNLAMDVFGACGYSKEYPVEKLLRDARAFQVVEGTGEMQRMCIARHLKAAKD